MSSIRFRRVLMRLSRQPRSQCWRAASGRRHPGGDLVGRAAGARWIGGGGPPARRRRAGRRAQSQPVGDGGVRAADKQSDVGVRTRKHTAQREARRPPERRCGECITVVRDQPRLSHDTHRQTPAEAAGTGAHQYRCRSRSVERLMSNQEPSFQPRTWLDPSRRQKSRLSPAVDFIQEMTRSWRGSTDADRLTRID